MTDDLNDKLLSNLNKTSGQEPIVVQEADSETAKTGFGLFTENEISFLRSVVANSGFSVTPRKVMLPKGYEDSSISGPVSFATISTSLAYHPDQNSVEHFKACRVGGRAQLFTNGDDLPTKDFKAFLKAALRDARQELENTESKLNLDDSQGDISRIIMLNEFGFPFPMDPNLRLAFMSEVEEFLMTIKPTTFWRQCYFILGSFHCLDTYTNNAVISLPYTPSSGRLSREVVQDNVSRIRNVGITTPSLESLKGERFSFVQEKFVPAEKIGEKLSPKDTVNWNYYETHVGIIGVLVCFDALDSRMLLKLTNMLIGHTDTDSRISMIFVPTFSHNSHVRESCKYLSAATNTLIVYVNNQYHTTSSETREAVKPSSPRYSSHGFFYQGQEIRYSKVPPELKEFFFAEEPATSVFDSDKNLWYSIATFAFDRNRLNDSGPIIEKRSDAFLDLFDISQ